MGSVNRPVRDAAPVARTRGRPRLAEVAEIDAQLLAAALAEFLQHGFGGASMRSIAKAAGVSRTTLVARFASKADLFRAIMTQQAARMAATSALHAEGPPALAQGLAAFGNRALAYSLEGDLLEINRLITSAAGQFPEVAAVVLDTTEAGMAQVAAFIARCAEADGVPCRDPAAVAECFILALRGWYGRVLLGGALPGAAEREAWVERMVEMLIAGRPGW
ncbi:MAG: helix-turn-helix transcriptional regulator [Sphingomonadales bacterium]|nr:helix-turn-helix transcriptional regulator [Sphingomonadales bacterium]